VVGIVEAWGAREDIVRMRGCGRVRDAEGGEGAKRERERGEEER